MMHAAAACFENLWWTIAVGANSSDKHIINLMLRQLQAFNVICQQEDMLG